MLKIGHRGAAGIAPENTKAAFIKAIQSGMDMVEVDLQLTKDQRLVVFHDYDLVRIAGIDRRISEMSLAELKEVDIGSFFAKEYANQRVLTLSELIELVRGRLALNIEIKINLVDRETILTELLRVLEKYNFIDQVIISSFDHKFLKKLKRINADLKTAILVSALVVNPITVIKAARADGIHTYSLTVTANLIEEVQQRGYFINVWTVNSSEELCKSRELGVDGVITDYPNIFRSYTREM